MLAGFIAVFCRACRVAMRHLCVMAGLFVVACFMMLGRFAVMAGCMVVIFRGGGVMFCAFMC